MTAARASELLGRFGRARVVVVGDVMLDHFLIGHVGRLSPEAPVPVVEYRADEYRLGGAANVASNVRALGGSPHLVGVVGADATADLLRAELSRGHLDAAGLLVDRERQTTRKVRVITERRQQVARIDYESAAAVGTDVEAALADHVARAVAGADVVIVSDYNKGVVSPGVMRVVIDGARAANRPVLVDPKIPHLDFYAGATLVTPNHHEAELATHAAIRTHDDARRAARRFRERARCQSVLITWGEHGMWLLDGPELDGMDTVKDGDQWIRAEHALPAVAREVADVTGAGDTVVATLALALASGATLIEAATIANHAAGISVAKFGPATVSSAELQQALAKDA